MAAGRVLRGLFTTLAVALVLAKGAATAWSHPLHTSLAELSFNAAKHTVEVSIRVFADDFGSAISGRNTARPTSTAGVPDAAAFEYVRSFLSLADQDGHPLPLRWHGTRRAGDILWISLDAPAPRGLRGLRVQNRLLFDLYDDQINIVQALYNDRRESLLFTKGDGAKTLP
jgi:hypothetical protein